MKNVIRNTWMLEKLADWNSAQKIKTNKTIFHLLRVFFMYQCLRGISSEMNPEDVNGQYIKHERYRKINTKQVDILLLVRVFIRFVPYRSEQLWIALTTKVLKFNIFLYSAWLSLAIRKLGLNFILMQYFQVYRCG